MNYKDINPAHIAIIMDGNGRWAQAKGLPRIAGHKKGAETIKAILETCIEEGISFLTLYAFSSENWQRPSEEVNYLMELLKYYLRVELTSLHRNNVCLKVIGDLSKLPVDIREEIASGIKLTENNKAITLNIALSYGSRSELTEAVKKIAQEVKEGGLDPSHIDEKLVSSYLYTANIPDPDLLIRTSGEQRLSNFLLWQLAYTELFFTNTLWPDFTPNDLKQAINEFKSRERRYGKT